MVKHKGKKGSLPPKGQLNPIKSRKQKRKEERKQKKRLKHDFYNKRRCDSKGGEEKEIESEEENDLKKIEERKKKEKEEKKRKQEKEKMKQRRKQLKRENEIEDKNIKRLEKQLKLNKRKGLPASFKEDGLDFLMEFCDADKTDLEQLIRNDDEEGESDEESNSNEDKEMEEGGEEREEETDNETEETNQSEDEEEMEEETEEEEKEEKETDEEEKEEETGAEEEEKETEEGIEKETEEKEWEDIYGRKRDAKGNILREEVKEGGSTKYVPPALRAKLSEGDREKRLRLERQVKGQLNRLAESNLHLISRQIEDYYSTNSRNDMNEVLCCLMTDSLIGPTITPERLIMEHAVLVAVLHANVGTEVGASIVQTMVTQFNDKYGTYESVPDDQVSPKELDNYVQLIGQLYAFKVIGSELIFGLLNKLAENFEDKDVELILIVLKSVGFLLRKDDPAKLKDLILNIQSQSSKKATENNGEAHLRVKFMLETLLAIKNNNVKKIPNYDPTQQQHLQKIIKVFLRGDCQVTPLKIGYNDLLTASTKGRWWVVGSAWTGKEELEEKVQISSGPRFSTELQDLARKMRMNTNARKSIFCSIMSSEDYIEATERVVKLTIKAQKEREVLFVILTCCLKEKKKFNPFYSQLVEKLAAVDRKYRIAAQFAIWDKVKEMKSLKEHEIHNLSLFTSRLIQTQVLTLSSLKVIEFSDLDKVSVGFLKTVLGQLLEVKDELKCEIFSLVAQQSKLSTFKEGLKLFMRHFMLKSNKELKVKIEQAESWLMSKDKRFVL